MPIQVLFESGVRQPGHNCGKWILELQASQSGNESHTFGIQTAGGSWSSRYLHFEEEYFPHWATGSIRRKAPPAVIHDHLPHIMPDRKRCKLCHKRGMENRSRFACVTCGAALCLQSDRNCFTLNRHSLNSMP